MWRVVACLVWLPCLAWAQTADIVRAIRAADWASARADAASYPDPVAAKLVTFYRLQHQNDGSAREIASFLAENPDWPAQAALLKRRDEALAAETDDAVVAPLCVATPVVAGPVSGAALARCADAAANLGQQADAAAYARSAWVAGFDDADAEGRFLARWQQALTPPDELQRFAALFAARKPQAAAQVARLAPADARLARARVALRAGDADAGALIAALPAAQRYQPDLVLDQLRAFNRAEDDAAGLALWRSHGFAAERAAGAAESGLFWSERSQLARRLLRAGDAKNAYALADDGLQTGAEQAADTAFLAGFIALRNLHQPAVAAAHFRLLAGSSSVISQSRAHYWLARAAEEAGDAAGARAEYGAAGAFATTFYGQLALIALGADAAALNARIGALADPAWTGQQALVFAGRELPRAAAMVVSWGDPIRARGFLQAIAAVAGDPATRSMDAHFAAALGLPDQAVMIARRAGRDGTLLPQAGWPVPVAVPEGPAPAAVSLAIMRQETSFEPGAVNPSGARGLMQLMPATASLVAKQTHQAPVPVAALTADPAANMRLGSAYLAQLSDQFGGSWPVVAAAYNAGPNRASAWLNENGDPRSTSGGADRVAMIDWIELIPFGETRNYVQRVIENIADYRAQRHEVLPYPMTP